MAGQLPHLFAGQAQRTPAAVALVHGEQSWTFAELQRRASCVAGHLRRLGAGPETRVGLRIERSPELVAAILGVWQAGAAYVPLDPGQPAARLEAMMEDAFAGETPLVVTRAMVGSWLEEGGAEDSGGGPQESDLAYLLYTSGTTGRPKGVMVEHGSLAQTFGAFRQAFDFGPGDRMPVLAPFSFDIFLFELLAPILSGGTAVLMDLQPVPDIPRLVATPGLTHLHAVPAVMRQIVDEARRRMAAPDLRHVFTGGDAVPPALLADLREVFPAARVTVLYGPTEATLVAASFTLDQELPAGNVIGRPLPGVALSLSEEGEILLGGPGVARGYQRRPDLTAVVFVPSSEGRVYRTGDLARQLADGTVEFLGRIDQQVKVRGVRIEPGEVEAALAAHPDVREAVVMTRPDSRGEKILAAWVVLKETPSPGRAGGRVGEGAGGEGLAAFLRGRLPEPMIPTAWAFLTALPLTTHGKVDRRALPEPESPAVTDGAAPRNEAEELLAGIWAEMLGREMVGVHDDFFAFGGHSLLAVQALARVREAFGIDVPAGAIFAAPTPAALAARIAAAPAGQSSIPLTPGLAPDTPPLSFAQERLWLLDQVMPSNVYNVPLALRLAGPLDIEAWVRSLNEVRRRHEALRTIFKAGPDGPVQIVEPFVPLSVPVIDLEGSGETEAMRLATEDAARPFDLRTGPLLRATLLRLGAEDHLAVIVCHHIVTDGWSESVLLREMEALYSSSPLPPVPVQYPDYAVWQRQQSHEESLAWWRQALPGDPQLDLPTDRSRPAVRSYTGSAVPVVLPGELTRSLHALARETGSTLFMVLLAAYAALLHRLTGSEDLRIGTPVANRVRPEIENLIGFFANTLVLRIDLSGEPVGVDLLARVRATALAAWAHQDVPFEKIVEALRPERRLDQNPLFQVAFGLNRQEATAWKRVPLHSGTAKFDLYLGLDEAADGGLSGAWELPADLFDPPTVQRFAGHWQRLLAGLAADPARRIGDLAMLSAAEGHQVCREPNDTAAEYPRDATLWELFERQAERAPQAVAVSQGEETLTYGELARRARSLGAHLRALGVGPDVPVAFALPQSFDRVVTVLGILEAGGAYVPLDLSHPRERLDFVMRDTGAPVVVTRKSALTPAPLPAPPTHPPGEGRQETAGPSVLFSPLPGTGRGEPGEGPGVRALRLGDSPEIRIVDLDDLSLDPVGGGPRIGPSSTNLAYILYTSGSTGTPKGIAVTQRNVARLVLGTDYAHFGPDEVFLQAAPIAFDASTLEIWGPLLHGGRLALPSVERPSLSELAREIRSTGVTTLWLTAGLFHQMVNDQIDQVDEIDAFAGVRQLLAGGDVVSAAAVRRVLARHPGLVVIDGYGPTEGTTFSCCHPMRDPEAAGSTVPIGRPIANAAALVLDPSLQPVPLGVPGELFLGGDGLARCYFGRPDLTAERFVPHPSADVSNSGERLYRTGDLVRRRTEGTLDFLGRIDLQVKVSGWRIEPAEIEAVLATHPAVRQSAVVARDGRLMAYVALGGGAPLPAGSLRAWLRDHLPEPMVPSVWVVLDRLPLTANGKIDRAMLPMPSPELSVSSAADRPRTPVEELLAGVWADLLSVERVGVHDNFFALGGHSLLATRLLARVRQMLGVDVPLRALFEEPTVDGLAARIALLQAEGDAADLPPLTPAPPAATYPASLGQRRLWFLQRLSPDGYYFNVSHGLRLRGPLQPEALRRALEEIVARHEPLRTTFETAAAGLPVQRIGPPPAVPLPAVDLSALPPERREELARTVALAAAEQPFDLSRGPLFRAVLARVDTEDHRLILTPHHLVFDGWSMEVLFRELAALYVRFSQNLACDLPPLPIRFADASEWQRQILAGPLRARQLAWWKEQLAGLEPLDLPGDRPRPAVQRFYGDWRTAALPEELDRALERLGRKAGATPFMVLLAGFATLLGRWSGKTDVPVGSPRADRLRPEVEGLIGFFVNTLVQRIDLSGDPSFSTVLARVRETALGAWTHQDLPFEMLVEELVPERDLSANPLFQVAFSLQETPGAIALPDLTLEPFDNETDVALFDLTLIVTRSPEGLALSANYRRDLFDAVTALRLLEQMPLLLAGAVADSEARAWELPLWSPAVWQQVTREWNDTATAGPDARTAVTVLDLFERLAASAPEALAVSGDSGGGERRLTYGELDREANRLAHHLRRRGVAYGDRVALVIEPSPALVTAALAVWKAGGVYVPLDPGAPAERLAGMMADAGAAIVLSRERLAARLAEAGLPVLRIIRIDADHTLWAAESGEAPARAIGASDLACIIYTSGSTGVPKGAVLAHRGLLNLARWHQRTFSLTPADRTAMVVNPSFDVCAWEMWPVLSCGASLHPLPRELVSSTAETARWMAAQGITLTFLPTPLAEDFLRRERPAGFPLRALYIGGDRLRYTPPADPGFRFVNAYGPAETSVVSTHADVIPDPAPARPPSIGRPMSDAQVHLLDAAFRLVPLGAVGEICVGGRGIASGYRNRAALTADRFIPDAFSADLHLEPGARLYRTGDLARRRGDGTLEFVGRADFQVKIRGVRIELGEVEAQLNRHPDLRAAVVAARDDSASGRRLVAWVVPKTPRTPGAEAPAPGELRDFLRARLPEVMVPTAWVVLDALPLTPRGKVDRRALPPPPPAAVSREAPQGQAEHAVARLWSEILGLAAVGRDDNFFDLGGHSLALAAVHERLQAELGLRISFVTLFECTTVRTLAARIAVPDDRPVISAIGAAPDVADRAGRQRGAAAWKERTRLARGLATPTPEEG
jgi:amino acid adenylation domain-containing protein